MRHLFFHLRLTLASTRGRAAALAWSNGQRPPEDSPDVSRPLSLPPFLNDSELADVTVSCSSGSFDPERLRRIMQEQGYAVITDVLSAQECSELTVREFRPSR